MSRTNLKENLVCLDNGYYLSKNDPLFWHKLFQRRPDNAEALFHVGMGVEIEAKKYLEKYYTTRLEKYLNLYKKEISRAFDLVNSSLNKGFFPARVEALRIEREMQLTEMRLSEFNKPSSFSKKQIILLFISAILISVITALIFLPHRDLLTMNYSEHHHTYFMPYEVIEGIPPKSVNIPDKPTTIVLPVKEISKEKIVNSLVERLKIDYKMDPMTAKQVKAVDEKSREIGMAVWEGGRKNIRVYVYPLEAEVAMDSTEFQLWETTTVIRSALYQFVKKNGYMPNNLKNLTEAYPNNYLTELPKDPYMINNAVTTSATNDGGWLFSMVEYPCEKDLVYVIKEAIKPNLFYNKDIPFTPLDLIIDKGNNMLSVRSGERIIRNYSVALGKDDTTPSGELFISRKLMNPDKSVPQGRNVYGTRAMELSNMNVAIHGTNTPATIGQNVSQGCIRMRNSDIEELYALMPLNTNVKISYDPSPVKDKESDRYFPNKNLYCNVGTLREEDPYTDYHWAN